MYVSASHVFRGGFYFFGPVVAFMLPRQKGETDVKRVPNERPVDIDFSKIPAVELRLLCKSAVQAAERFYSVPENVRKFEEWKAAQVAQAAEQK